MLTLKLLEKGMVCSTGETEERERKKGGTGTKGGRIYMVEHTIYTRTCACIWKVHVYIHVDASWFSGGLDLVSRVQL